ncbi:hypothetical protein P280DRAFT_554596 [Massarina eburnea CBS 473.64]|uniref:Uncharacterized protein n=1 Tax=Massarina eburnea CBS 473.64 TaxID=1395130 RepID=A0A6A6RJ10_9PLEO|nr:hypothetical protein P280DRAFT_554596 [Massarina eburnea CBS 473.64]
MSHGHVYVDILSMTMLSYCKSCLNAALTLLNNTATDVPKFRPISPGPERCNDFLARLLIQDFKNLNDNRNDISRTEIRFLEQDFNPGPSKYKAYIVEWRYPPTPIEETIPIATVAVKFAEHIDTADAKYLHNLKRKHRTGFVEIPDPDSATTLSPDRVEIGKIYMLKGCGGSHHLEWERVMEALRKWDHYFQRLHRKDPNLSSNSIAHKRNAHLKGRIFSRKFY